MKFIKDEEFIRSDVPMTKEDIRILTFAKLELDSTSNFLDIGSGTGSMTVQASKICKNGQVVSIERDEEAIKTTKINIDKFNCTNINLIEGDAIEVLSNIKMKFHGIFLGGTGGNMECIIDKSLKLLENNGMLVANFITITNLNAFCDYVEKKGLKVDITMLQVSKAFSYALLNKFSNFSVPLVYDEKSPKLISMLFSLSISLAILSILINSSISS